MDLSDKRMLLVEDNELNIMMEAVIFTSYNFQIEEAVNGEEAVEKIKNNPEGYYDIIFMDILMPVKDGIEATKEIRAMDRLDTMIIPIVAMTAESDAGEIEKYPEYGFTDYIEKPMDSDAVDVLVRKYFE